MRKLIIIFLLLTPICVAQGATINFSPDRLKLYINLNSTTAKTECPLPELLTMHNTPYPKEEIMKRSAGYVLLSYEIDAQGKVGNIEIIATSQKGSFDRAVIEELEKARYSQSFRTSECLKKRYKAVYQFRINSKCSIGFAPPSTLHTCISRYMGR